MKMLPQSIKERFYKTIKGDISLEDFEQWLYADKELEKYLSHDDYLDLISLSFKKNGAKYDLWNLLKKHIDLGEYETYKMLLLLKEAQQKTDRLPYILIEFYRLYCKGYGFLRDLGLGIGLAVEVPAANNKAAYSLDELKLKEQKELLNSFSPELEECLSQAIYWLETGKIILTGEQDDIGCYGYNDLRTKEEKESKLWVVVSETKNPDTIISKNLLWDKPIKKKWWKFWKK